VNDDADTITISSTSYVKPPGGIPKADLDAAVQASLSKADTALQTVPPLPNDVGRVRAWNGTAFVAPTVSPTIFTGGATAPSAAESKDGDLWLT